MHWGSALRYSDRHEYKILSRKPSRDVRFHARILDKDHKGLPHRLNLVNGSVEAAEKGPGQPTHTCHLTFLDPHDKLRVHLHNTRDSKLFFNKMIEVSVKIWSENTSKWLRFVLFTGWVTGVDHDGSLTDVDCASKDIEHMPPYVFDDPYTIRRHTRFDHAIHHLMWKRGERRFDIHTHHHKLHRHRAWHIGASPWHAVHKLAHAMDHQIGYRTNGVLRTRPWPERPSWTFAEGSDSVTVDYSNSVALHDFYNEIIVRGRKKYKVPVHKHTKLSSKAAVGDTNVNVTGNATFFATGGRIEIGRGSVRESRTITSVSGNQVNFAKNALNKAHPKGAHVTTRVKVDRFRSITARSKIKHHNPMSARSLTGGDRPRVKVVHNTDIHKYSSAKHHAKRAIRRMSHGVDVSLQITCLPVYPLELGDIIKVTIGSAQRRTRVRTYSLPLNLTDPMTINWQGRQSPHKPRRHRHHRHRHHKAHR